MTRGSRQPISWVENENGCWICTSHATPHNRYIKITRNYKNLTLHRLMYEKYKGKIPDGLCVRHTCDNTACINPAHLVVGTFADNKMDAVERDRHARGARHGMAKLTEKEVLAIRKSDKKNILLAKEFCVSPLMISFIKRRKSWKCI